MQRFMDAHKVVMHKMQRNHVFQSLTPFLSQAAQALRRRCSLFQPIVIDQEVRRAIKKGRARLLATLTIHCVSRGCATLDVHIDFSTNIE